MATIKGITIEINGNTTPLQKSLQDVNKSSRDLQTELRQVERMLKLDPGNTELIAQKQKLLAQSIDNTSEKLRRLKDAEKQVQDQFAQGKISEEQYRAFQRELQGTEAKLKSLKGEAEKLNRTWEEAGKKIGEIGTKSKEVGQAMLPVTAAIGGAGIAAVKIGSDFEAGMSKVSAVSGATGKDLERLTDTARELGSTTQFSASEAAAGMQFLGQAGFDTNEIIDSMPGLLSLAASGALDLGEAADIASNIMSGFSMEASEAGHVSDVLAQAAADSNTNVSQLGEAMKYLAPVANTMGWSIEESTSAVMAMSDAGIQGSMAGQAFATSLTRLAKPTKEMQKVMDELQISFFDAQGNMKPMPELVGDIEESTKGMTAEQKSSALSTLFGAEAYKHWAVLLEKGSVELDKNTKALETADGAAKNMADTMNDNLQGRIKEMLSALEEVALMIYDSLQPALEKVVQWVTELARWFQELSPTTQTVIVVLAGLVAALAPLLILFGMMASGVSAIITLFTSFGSVMGILTPVITAVKTAFMALNATMLANPIGIVIAALTALIGVFIYLWNTNEGFRDAVIRIWETLKTFFIDTINYIKDLFQTSWEFISTLVTDVCNSIQNVITTVFNAIKSFFTTIWEAYKAIFSTYLSFIKALVTGDFETIQHIIVKVWNYIKAFLDGIWESIKSIFSSALDFAQSIFSGAWDAMIDVVTSAWTSIKSGVTDIANVIVDTIKSIDLFQIGKDIINGLIDGIASMASAVWDCVTDIGNSIMDGFKGMLGINSPSRVFKGYGVNINEGLVEGIERSSNALMRTVRDT
ncbi:MAG: phage tail tape measure protein, partial [Bacilli bacterium]